MRHLIRQPLSSQILGYMSKKQTAVDAGSDATVTWDRSQSTKPVQSLKQVLCKMTGTRERCMYCGDSLGDTIDHFYPKAGYPERTFRWENLLLTCSHCNRRKGDRFPTDTNGSALLIDPTVDYPWDHLFFDSKTGILTARFHGLNEDPKGVATTNEQILPLNRDAVASGRIRFWQKLVRLGCELLELLRNNAVSKANVKLAEFIDTLASDDSYGLGSWTVHRDGRREKPFCELNVNYRAVWESIEASVHKG